MKNLTSELEGLMAVAKVNNMRKDKIRRDFVNFSEDEKKSFVTEFQWRIIKNTKK